MNLREEYVASDLAHDAARAKLRAFLRTLGLEEIRAYTWCYVDAEGTLHIRGWDGETIPQPTSALVEAGFTAGVWLDSRVLWRKRVYIDAAGTLMEPPGAKAQS